MVKLYFFWSLVGNVGLALWCSYLETGFWIMLLVQVIWCEFCYQWFLQPPKQ